MLRTAARQAYLVDLLTLPDRPDVVESLVADAAGLARDRGAAQLVFWLPHRHPYRGALFRVGFLDSRIDPGVGFHGVDMPAARLSLLANPATPVHFVLGDTDLA